MKKKAAEWRDYPHIAQLEARLAEYERLRQEWEQERARLIVEKKVADDASFRLVLAIEHLSTLAIPLERLTRRLES